MTMNRGLAKGDIGWPTVLAGLTASIAQQLWVSPHHLMAMNRGLAEGGIGWPTVLAGLTASIGCVENFQCK